MHKILSLPLKAGIILSSLIFSGCAGMQMAKLQLEAKAYYDRLGDSPLRPYLLCGSGNGVQVFALNGRGNQSETFRLIRTESKIDTISVIEGYRVMFAYPDADYFFANVKVEASHPAKYDSDKIKLLYGLKWLTTKDSSQNILQQARLYNGVEIHGIRSKEFDYGGTIAIDNIFLDTQKIVVSIYYLNQGKKNRHFNDLAEFQTLRDAFIERWTTCAEKIDSTRSAKL
jgi:hypothetical protein